MSLLLFAVVSSEERSGLPFELLYADDLVLMALTMKQCVKHVAEWSVSLLDRGLRVNTWRSKVIVAVVGR